VVDCVVVFEVDDGVVTVVGVVVLVEAELE
jgi:hypothetical protein